MSTNKFTREQFLAELARVAKEVEEDHEEQTGVTAEDERSWQHWIDDVTSCHENTYEPAPLPLNTPKKKWEKPELTPLDGKPEGWDDAE